MNQTGLSGIPRPAQARGAKIERQGDITNSQVVYGDNNVVIWGDGNTVIQKVTPNQRPNVARLPAPTLVGRPAHAIRLLDRTAEKRLAKGSLASGAPVEFYGPAGLGKSTLLRYLAAELAMQDGMVFLELRNSKKLEDLLQELFEAFYQSDQNFAPNEVQLRRYFENIQALILLDDANLSREELQSLRYMLPRCVLVTTSAEQRLWGEGDAIGLRGLPMKQALALLQQYVGRRLSAAESPAAERICAALEGSPLQIIQAAATVRSQKKSLEDLARQFETPAPEPSLQGLSVSSLPDPQKNLLAVLAVLGTAPLPAEHIAEILQTQDLAPVVKDLLERGLIKAHSPRYSLTGSLDVYLNRAWDLSQWKETVLRHFTGWSGRPLSREQVTDASEAVFKVLEDAATANRWREVLQIGQAVEPVFILGRRWGAWARVLPYLLRAAQVLGERGIEAWALHEAGSRLLCTGQFQQARDLLSRALEIRKAIGDKSGIAATEHNLAQLPGGTPPRNPPRTRGGSSRFNGWILPVIGLVVGAAILGGSLWARAKPVILPTSPSADQPIVERPATLTPSVEPSLTPTGSRTPLPTLTPSLTPSRRPSETASRTVTPSLTPSITPSLTLTSTANPPPPAPDIIAPVEQQTVQCSSSAVDLTWYEPYDSSGIDSYQVWLQYYDQSSQQWVTLLNREATYSTEMDITSFVNSYCGSWFSWSVLAVDRDGAWGDWAQTVRFYSQAPNTPPPAPVIVSPTQDGKMDCGNYSVVLKWEAPYDPDGIKDYEVVVEYYDIIASDGWTSLWYPATAKNGVTGTQLDISSIIQPSDFLCSSTTRSFRWTIRARDAAGLWGESAPMTYFEIYRGGSIVR